MPVVPTWAVVGNKGIQLFILWLNYIHFMDPHVAKRKDKDRIIEIETRSCQTTHKTTNELKNADEKEIEEIASHS